MFLFPSGVVTKILFRLHSIGNPRFIQYLVIYCCLIKTIIQQYQNNVQPCMFKFLLFIAFLEYIFSGGKNFNKQFKSTFNQTENAYECITLQVKGEDGKWRWTWSERSVPVNHKPYLTAGIYINAEGPTHIHDVKFRNFAGDTVNTEYCGIAFKDNFDMGMGASSSVKGKMQAEVSILSTCFDSSQ